MRLGLVNVIIYSTIGYTRLLIGDQNKKYSKYSIKVSELRATDSFGYIQTDVASAIIQQKDPTLRMYVYSIHGKLLQLIITRPSISQDLIDYHINRTTIKKKNSHTIYLMFVCVDPGEVIVGNQLKRVF